MQRTATINNKRGAAQPSRRQRRAQAQIGQTTANGIRAEHDTKTDTVHIIVDGHFDRSVVPHFRAAYEALPRAKNYVVDLSRSDALTGSSVGMLMIMHGWASEKSTVKVEVLGVSSKFRRLLILSRLANAISAQTID